MSSFITAVHAMLEALLFNKTAGRPGDSWSRLTDLPFARHSAGVTIIGSDVYIFGGQDPIANTVTTDTLFRYNLETNETVQLSSGPPVRTAASLTAVNGKLYVVGGCATYGKNVAIKDVWCYTPETDSWERKADMSFARHSHTATAIGSKLYIAGGRSSSGATNMRQTLCYDTETDIWTVGVGLIPTNTRHDHATAEYGGKLYTQGGFISSTLRDFSCYDPVTDTWSVLVQCPQSKQRHVAAVVGDRLILLMGDSQSGSIVYQYDFIGGGWIAMKTALLSNNSYSAGVVYKNEIYVFGGSANSSVGLFRYTP